MEYDPQNVMGTIGVALGLGAVAAAYLIFRFLSQGWCC